MFYMFLGDILPIGMEVNVPQSVMFAHCAQTA